MSINFQSEEIDFELADSELTMQWVQDVAKKNKAIIDNIDYIFCSDEYLLSINKEHLDHDYYTDIITFPYSYDPIQSDIFISIDRVKENAKDLGETFERELHRVIIHGLLHMMRYEDGTGQEKSKMRSKENECLDELGKFQ